MKKEPLISRRDFLNGIALTIGANLLPLDLLGSTEFAPEKRPDYYPPALTGLRGDHEGSFEVAHALRDGTFWSKGYKSHSTGEVYDLVIVGGGISGLSAAYFYRKIAPKSRILILDNHDDFGGHAKRNEFRINRKTILGYGGSWSIDSPGPYSSVAKGLIHELGIDVTQWRKVLDGKLYSSLNLQSGVFFDQETFGTDRLLAMAKNEYWDSIQSDDLWKNFLAMAPLSDEAKRDLSRLFTTTADYMPGLSSRRKKAKLATISYRDFLLNYVKVHQQVIQFLQSRSHGLYGVGIDAVPAQDAWGLGFPGFDGMKLDHSFGKGMNRDAMHDPAGGEAFFFHFPDGNATVARLLVQRMIPQTFRVKTLDELITAKCNYAQLDQPASLSRIRLNSTVVRVRHTGIKNDQVEVDYLRGQKLHNVIGKHCILACWNSVIPYICPELPQPQKEDLAYAVKIPLLYTNVLIANWNSFVKAGVRNIYSPGAFHSWVALDAPVSIGPYQSAKSPNEPIVVHMMRTPCAPGLPAQSQHRAGRFELYSTPFGTYEHQIRNQLSRMLAPFGFDASQDIRAITVNRWAHGYAYQYNSLFDSFWLEGKETPCERARKPFGHIAIANADAGAYAYMDSAIDQAYRAVKELL